MYIMRLAEPSMRAWFWRLLIGPANIVDGVIAILTLGTIGFSCSYNVARKLHRARCLSEPWRLKMRRT